LAALLGAAPEGMSFGLGSNSSISGQPVMRFGIATLKDQNLALSGSNQARKGRLVDA
jgi:hypothetical protein